MKTVTLLGLGRMGAALATALLRAGHAVHVWNRSAHKAEPLLALGARTGTLEAVLAASDLIVVNVLDYGASDALLRTPEAQAALDGKTLLQLTSGSPRQARDAGGWAARYGIAYLDGAIMATPGFIGQPGATLLYAGPQPTFAQWREVLLAFGGNPVFVSEDFGGASALDSVLLTQMWGALFGHLQAVAVARAEGIPLDTYAKHVRAFQPVVDAAGADLVARVRDGRDLGDADTLATLAAHYSAFVHLRDVTAQHGLHAAIPEAFDRLFRAALDDGHGGDDFALLARYVEAGAGRGSAKEAA
ncbi:NAD(P)-dependent oxidoreductase [Luteimonas salinilitoris]|uniref:NAD(P)-dependent oxidoreductase n=1 Tax=Luteimonas salinilitoris TaxID=3237697 RepID=A0ABV4HYM2_9GAMM